MRGLNEQINGWCNALPGYRESRKQKRTIKQVEKICKEWGGIDDWGVAYVYVGTLLEKLVEAEA